MLTMNDKQYRNLEEQVGYNTALLNTLPFGILGTNFQGILRSEHLVEKGKIALVGESVPYTLYYRNEANKVYNLGEFPREGEQGERGLQGPKGEKGDSANNWVLGTELPPVGPIDEPFMNVLTGDIYQSNGTDWILLGTLRGP